MTVPSKGLPFDAESIQAFKDKRKTMTRRVMDPQPDEEAGYPIYVGIGHPEVVDKDGELQPGDPIFAAWWEESHIKCPYPPGSIVYAKEAVHHESTEDKDALAIYSADDEVVVIDGRPAMYEWKPPRLSPLFMPRRFARFWFRVTHATADRVQDISWLDAIAEGMKDPHRAVMRIDSTNPRSPVFQYRNRWDFINAKAGYAWRTNPMVWAYTLEQIDRPPDP